MQKGTYQDMPPATFTLGMEAAGEAIELERGVHDRRLGDRVIVISGRDGLAEEGVFDTNWVLSIPDDMSFLEAAAFPVPYGTGHLALAHRAKLLRGETLSVTGAAGVWG